MSTGTGKLIQQCSRFDYALTLPQEVGCVLYRCNVRVNDEACVHSGGSGLEATPYLGESPLCT
jgi:hypothetical protein